MKKIRLEGFDYEKSGINMCKVGNITYESLSLVVVETADCGDVMNACSLLEKTLKISGKLFGI